jgi:phosphoserine phosphatase
MATYTVASDLEGTITAGETWRGMRNYLVENGYEQRYRRFFLRRIPGLFLFRMGRINDRAFKERWLLGLLRLFRGFTKDEIEMMAEFVVLETLWPARRESVIQELQQHQANGRSVVIVSGQFEPILAQFVYKMGEFETIGTPLAYENGRFTGHTAAPLNVGPNKVVQLKPYLTNGKLAAAYGDTVSDIPMLELALEPVAVYPDEILRETAVNRGWRILET